MNVSAIDDMAREYIKNTDLVKRLKTKKFLSSIVVRINKRNELRVFIREEVGKNAQYVAWLSESDIDNWMNSTKDSYMHFKTWDQRNAKNKEPSLTI